MSDGDERTLDGEREETSRAMGAAGLLLRAAIARQLDPAEVLAWNELHRDLIPTAARFESAKPDHDQPGLAGADIEALTESMRCLSCKEVVAAKAMIAPLQDYGAMGGGVDHLKLPSGERCGPVQAIDSELNVMDVQNMAQGHEAIILTPAFIELLALCIRLAEAGHSAQMLKVIVCAMQKSATADRGFSAEHAMTLLCTNMEDEVTAIAAQYHDPAPWGECLGPFEIAVAGPMPHDGNPCGRCRAYRTQ